MVFTAVVVVDKLEAEEGVAQGGECKEGAIDKEEEEEEE